MAGFDHHPAARESTPASEIQRTARYGLALFAVYTVLYAAFMLVNAFAPHLMERIVFAGINWAVLSGLLLIVAAFALALVYVWLCRGRSAAEGRP